MFTAEKLEILRELTTLGPIARIKLLLACKEAEKNGEYDKVDYLEYSLRMESFRRIVEPVWKMYASIEHDGYGLMEFAESTLEQHIEKKKAKVLKK